MVRINVRPFDGSRDIDSAAKLLAGRHARVRAGDDRFPASFQSPDACKPLVEEGLAASDAFGVVAEVDGSVAGFMIMSTYMPAPTHMTANYFAPRTVQIGYPEHAVTPGLEHEAYREMYAVLAEHFVERGFFDHLVYISPSETAVAEAFVSLSFGRSLTAAMRGIEPLEAAVPTGVDLHKAGAEDLSVITVLGDDLTRHHSASPIYWPHVHEADAHAEQFQLGLLQQPDVNAHWVAYENGKALGMNTFMAPDWITPMLRPENLVYLYQGIVSPDARRGGVGGAILSRGIDWAREQGYEHVALHFASPNVSGARFWLSQGFVPIEHRLARRIDDRVAWAR